MGIRNEFRLLELDFEPSQNDWHLISISALNTRLKPASVVFSGSP